VLILSDCCFDLAGLLLLLLLLLRSHRYRLTDMDLL